MCCAIAKPYKTKVGYMESFILILLMVVSPGEVQAKNLGSFQTMNQCFEARELIVKNIGRPIVNYQAVCVLQKEE